MFTREASRGFTRLRRYVEANYPNVVDPEWTVKWTPPQDPWLTIEVQMIPERWAIWRASGAVHRFDRNNPGAVEDDPIEFPLAHPDATCPATVRPGVAHGPHTPTWEYEMGSVRPVGGWCMECAEGLDPAKGPDAPEPTEATYGS